MSEFRFRRYVMKVAKAEGICVHADSIDAAIPKAIDLVYKDQRPVTVLIADNLEKKIEELEAQQQWQPIETAPKDGAFHVRGLWVHKHNAGYEWQQFVGYIDDDGDFVDDYGDSHTGWDTEDFSHWMPLPEPPEAIKGEGDG